MKNEISKDIKSVYEAGKLDALKVKDVIKRSTEKEISMLDKKTEKLDLIAKEAVTSAINELKKLESITKENIEASVDGAIEGTSKFQRDAINEIDMDLLKTKYRLQEEKDKLASSLKDALLGAREAADNFSEETKHDIEESVIEAKLKSAQILGLMEETIKQSVKKVIEEGNNVEKKVFHITQKAIQNALEFEQLSAKKVKEISEGVILSAIEAAQETNKNIQETAKGAVSGVKAGISNSIEVTKKRLIESKEKAEDFVIEELQDTIENLKLIESNFIKALHEISRKVGSSAKKVLNETLETMEKETSTLKDKAEKTIEEFAEQLKERGIEVIDVTKEKAQKATELAKEEIIHLSNKMVKISKGAISGMIEGTKKAINEKENK
jgi:ElaB/YqjD/DUF883 family membrane-anchored ribosome-binding protein